MIRQGALFVFVVGLACPQLWAGTSGCVLSVDGTPVSDAELRVYKLEPRLDQLKRLAAGGDRPVVESTRSDEAGGFFLATPLGGGRELHVVAPGFAPEVIRSADSDAFSVVLFPAATVTGMVTTARGRAAVGATVVWRMPLGEEWIAVTDDQGRYEMPDPSMWAFQVEVYHPDYGLTTRRFMDFMTTTHTPLSADIELATNSLVEGTVVGGDGKPVEGADVYVNGWPTGISDAGGSFNLHATEGADITAIHGDWVARAAAGNSPLPLSLEPGRVVHGQVIDEETGAGVAFAHVLVQDRGDYTSLHEVVCDENGRYEVALLPPATYTVSVVDTAYGPESETAAADLRRVRSVSLRHTVSRQRVMAGTVVDQQSRPVAGALVMPQQEGSPLIVGVAKRLNRWLRFTDCAGRFEMPVLDGGEKYRAAAVKTGFAPGTSAWIEPQEVTGDISITLPAGHMVEGRVQGPGARPLAGVEIAVVGDAKVLAGMPPALLFDRVSGVTWLYASNDDGSFEIPLAEGQWYLGFSKPGYAAAAVPSHQVEDGAEELRVTLNHVLSARGRVMRPDGSPAEDADVYVNRADRLAGPAAVTDPMGRFEVAVQSSGVYTLRVNDKQSGGVVTVPIEIPGPEITVELPTTFSVTGWVIDSASGQALSEARVRSEAVRRRVRHAESAPTNSSGRFTVKGLEAGRYHLKVTANGYLHAVSPELIVGSGDAQEEITVALVRGLRVTGRAVDERGNALENVHVSLDRSDREDGQRISDVTDSEGGFELEGMPAGEVALRLTAEGFAPGRHALILDADELDLVIELGKGLELHGRVVDAQGNGLADASVDAESDGEDKQYLHAITDSEGAFHIKGMSPGMWTITGRLSGFETASIDGFDPNQRSSVRLVLEERATGVVFGTVEGLVESLFASVSVRTEDSRYGGWARGQVEDDGSYRVEKTPAGIAQVTVAEYGHRSQRSRSRSVEIPAGGEVRVDFDFDEGSRVSGRVTRDGRPVMGAGVNISSQTFGGSDAISDADGYYQTEVPDGSYKVSARTVDGLGQSYRLEVQGPTVFDIELAGATLVGRVLDGVTGDPIAGAEVEAEQRSDLGSRLGSEELRTDSTGSFHFDDLAAGPQIIRVDHPNYGQHRQVVDLSAGSRRELEVVLEKAEGMIVFLLDGRTGQALSGTVVARDMNNVIVYDGSPPRDGKGVRLPLHSGTYKVSASSTGYATHTLVASAPSDEVIIGLTPGGTLIVRSTELAPRLAKLVMPSGEEYVRCWCNRIAEIRLEGGITGIENVAAGSYSFVVLEKDGSTSTYPVTVSEGQTVEVVIR